MLSKKAQLKYRGKKTKRRRSTLQSVDRKLWRMFSEYIRKRDRLKGTELVKCISCGKVVPWRESDAGHFQNRRWKSTRFDEKNVNAQCRRCNRFTEGDAYAYARGVDAKYGAGTADALYKLSRIPSKLTRDWYEEKIKYYNISEL